ncbi:hypothetical protein D3C81_755390 [compost metagenome]
MVAINANNLYLNGLSAQALSATAAAEREQAAATGTRQPDEPLSIRGDSLKLGSSGEAQSAPDIGASDEPASVKQLREIIKRLQKQLAEEQRQLAELMARQMDETTKAAAVSAKQASIATLTGEILAATAQLLEALQKTGGSSAGGMVSTRA